LTQDAYVDRTHQLLTNDVQTVCYMHISGTFKKSRAPILTNMMLQDIRII
jgi:hypothetical protein